MMKFTKYGKYYFDPFDVMMVMIYEGEKEILLQRFGSDFAIRIWLKGGIALDLTGEDAERIVNILKQRER